MSTAAVVVAAGSGERMGAGMPKALVPLCGRPLVRWCLAALAAEVRAIVVTAPPGHEDDLRGALADAGVAVVTGGATRARSVACGLAALPAAAERVLVHDAARPLLRPELVTAVLSALDGVEGAIAAAPVADTLKREGAEGLIAETVARSGLWTAQTPQAFRVAALRAAVEEGERAGTLDAATDCAALVERVGGRVRLVPSLSPNIKITTPADLALAEQLLAASGRSESLG